MKSLIVIYKHIFSLLTRVRNLIALLSSVLLVQFMKYI